jgi:D-alanyl-D-alanine carboxypeptidase (penicillin-binding protein 5/6)
VEKKITVCLGLIMLCLTWGAPDVPEPPPHLAEAVVVLDLSTGTALAGANVTMRRQPGPLGQLATALAALDKLEERDWVVASPEAASVSGTRRGLLPHQALTAGALVRDMLVHSANDAAWALAEAAAGSVGEFVQLMNAKAAEIGLQHSRFTNPMGLDTRGQYSSALDLAKLAQAALAHPILQGAASQQNFLWRFPGATGLKAGYSEEAGYCCLLSAQQNGIQLVVAVLGARTENHLWLDAIRWLRFGFAHYESLLEKPMVADINSNGPCAHP